MSVAFRNVVDDDGYLVRTALEDNGGVHKKKRVRYSRGWWLGKHHFEVTIRSLPERYWGKRVRIKVEVEEAPSIEIVDEAKHEIAKSVFDDFMRGHGVDVEPKPIEKEWMKPKPVPRSVTFPLRETISEEESAPTGSTGVINVDIELIRSLRLRGKKWEAEEMVRAHQRRNAKLKKQGLCLCCGKEKTVENRSQCASCIKKNKQKNKDLIVARIRAGMCSACGKNKLTDQYITCKTCREKGKKNWEKYGKVKKDERNE
jgi:hypothetical protein